MQWCHAVGARGSAAPIVFQLAGAPLPYFVNIFELVMTNTAQFNEFVYLISTVTVAQHLKILHTTS